MSIHIPKLYMQVWYKDQSTILPGPYWLIDPIKTRSVLSKVTPFDLRNISNKRFVACLHDFMENDPIGFSILRGLVSTKFVRGMGKRKNRKKAERPNLQTLKNSGVREV